MTTHAVASTGEVPRPAHRGESDLVTSSDLRAIAGHHGGPCVSLFLPTHRGGPQTRQDPIRLRNLLDDAAHRLAAAGLGPRGIKAVLGPHRALLDEPEFWRHLSDGLALYAAPGFARRFRVPLDLDEESWVSATFRIRPLLPLLADNGQFFVLALSQGAVSLYVATRTRIAQLPQGSIPASLDDALAYEVHERRSQFRPGGGSGPAPFPGHAPGEEVDKATLERFFRAVDRGVTEVLDGTDRPLVLASVDYYLPIYRALSNAPTLLDRAVEGNPEHRSLAELHDAAWAVAEPTLAAARDKAVTRAREAPTRRVASELADVVAASDAGEVDTLLVAPGPPLWGRVDPRSGIVERLEEPEAGAVDLLDRAAADTLSQGGTVFVVAPEDCGNGQALALLRY